MNSHRTEYKHIAHVEVVERNLYLTHNIQSYTGTSDEHAPIY